VPRPEPSPPAGWTPFGRRRRPTPVGRALGGALLLLALLLTLWWAAGGGGALDGPAADRGAAARGPATGTVADAGASDAAAPVAAAPACGPEAPAGARPLTLPLPAARGDPWSGWVGQEVCLTHPLVVAEVYELLSRRRLVAAASRPWATTPPDALARGSLVVRPADGAATARLLDADGRSGRADGGGAWSLGPGDLRNGDALEGLHGRLRREGDDLVLEAPALTVRRLNPRPAAPPALAGGAFAAAGADPPAIAVRVAGVNLLNWFTTLGDRGAATAAALERQAAKLVATLAALDADALALAEVENDGTGAALDDLLRRLNAAQRAAGRGPAADYVAARAPPGGSGGDAIRVAIAYRPAALTLLETAADRARVHDRAPLAAAFALPDGRPAFTLVAAHHKSKGGCPASGDVDRGSGCWDLRRDAQSQALLDFADRLVAAGGPPVLVVGDLNAYRHEAPVRRFAEAGWRVLVDDMPEERAYSYVHFGRAGALDHAAASPALAGRLLGAAFWPINADEPPRSDERRATPYRSSDHDPLLLALGWD